MQHNNLGNPLKNITDKLLAQIGSSEDSVSKVEQRSIKRIEEIEKLLLSLKKEVSIIIDKHSRRQRDYQEEKKRLIKFTKLYKEDPVKNEALYFKVYQEADSVKKEMLELEIKESSLKERRVLLEQEYRDMEKISKDSKIVRESIGMAKAALSGEFLEIKKEIDIKDFEISSLKESIEAKEREHIEKIEEVNKLISKSMGKAETVTFDLMSNAITIIENAENALNFENVKKAKEITTSLKEEFTGVKNMIITLSLIQSEAETVESS